MTRNQQLRTAAASATVVALGSMSALHALWGQGSTFPFASRHDLNDNVIGQQVTPSPAACNAVAGLLAVSAVSVGRATAGSPVARFVTAGVGTVLLVRSVLGFAGRTHIAVPGSTSTTFQRNDRRYFAPLCATLALGAAIVATGVGLER